MSGLSADAATKLLIDLSGLRWKPTLAWSVRWAPDGRDPIPAAWAGCTRPWVLLVTVSPFPARWERALNAYWRGVAAHHTGRTDETCPACCDAIRAAVPGPTLADYLALR